MWFARDVQVMRFRCHARLGQIVAELGERAGKREDDFRFCRHFSHLFWRRRDEHVWYWCLVLLRLMMMMMMMMMMMIVYVAILRGQRHWWRGTLILYCLFIGKSFKNKLGNDTIKKIINPRNQKNCGQGKASRVDYPMCLQKA